MSGRQQIGLAIEAMLTERELTTLTNGLSVAAQRFDESAAGLAALYAFSERLAHYLLLAAAFQNQAEETRELLAKVES